MRRTAVSSMGALWGTGVSIEGACTCILSCILYICNTDAKWGSLSSGSRNNGHAALSESAARSSRFTRLLRCQPTYSGGPPARRQKHRTAAGATVDAQYVPGHRARIAETNQAAAKVKIASMRSYIVWAALLTVAVGACWTSLGRSRAGARPAWPAPWLCRGPQPSEIPATPRSRLCPRGGGSARPGPRPRGGRCRMACRCGGAAAASPQPVRRIWTRPVSYREHRALVSNCLCVGRGGVGGGLA